MSISDRLREQYREKAAELQPPENQPRIYGELFEKARAKETGFLLRRRLLVVALAVLSLAVIAGFTRYAWVHFGDNRVRVEYRQTVSQALDRALSSQIHERLAAIEDQLGAGESAVVYVPELPDIFPEMKGIELISVAKPAAITDSRAWENAVAGREEKMKRLPEGFRGFHFENGRLGGRYGGEVSPESLKLLPELREESAARGGETVWRKQAASTEETVSVLTAIYRNDDGEEAYVSVQRFERKAKLKFVMAVTGAEEIDVNGMTVRYSLAEPFFFSGSNRSQQLQWVETLEDRSLLYTVGSASSVLTKNELVEVMKGLKASY